MKARLERQPNGDACSAFYIGDSSVPLYVRDSRVEIWREALKRGDFTSDDGTTEETARLVVATFDEWVNAIVSGSVVWLSQSFAKLPDDRYKARLASALKWLVDMHRPLA